jgi:hypothetical protein
MRLRQTTITMQDLAAMGSGFFIMQFLRVHGLNPEGNIQRSKETKDGVEYMVYTEILDQERKPDGEGQEEAGKVPALALGI